MAPVDSKLDQILKQIELAKALAAFPVPDDPDTLLTRKDTAAALTAKGFPTSPATLATLASRGGGPPYQLYGPLAMYNWSNSLQWAKSRLSRPRSSTSEADAVLRSSDPPGSITDLSADTLNGGDRKPPVAGAQSRGRREAEQRRWAKAARDREAAKDSTRDPCGSG
jgi:hypothetical protein